MKKELKLAEELIEFINQSPTAFHAVDRITKTLANQNFIELVPGDKWELKNGGKYYVTINQSACLAFVVGEGVAENGFKIIGTHTDSPSFRIKPRPEMVDNGYLKLNTEVYGGPILNTWLDRPLALAGRVSLRSKNPLRPAHKLVNINKPVAIIPNLSIHINPKVNEGWHLNKQKDTLPMLQVVTAGFERNHYLLNLLSNQLKVKPNDILDFDLFLYEYERGSVIGLEQEFISASRIDDLSMVHAGLKALCSTTPTSGINVLACFDNEEVGSTTKQGADSPMLAHLLERIILCLNKNKIVLSNKSREDYFRALANSFLISADMAHAVHPNSPERHDPTNKPLINQGPVIKVNANQKYTSDSDSVAVFERLCTDNNIPVQKFVNRSDVRGGSTIGPISASQVNIRAVDIGNPMLAMHSIRELAGVKDHSYIISAFEAFYKL
ncbi:M18 family aminopeptidase [Peptococcaceae bacterium 1198_IL3148]